MQKLEVGWLVFFVQMLQMCSPHNGSAQKVDLHGEYAIEEPPNAINLPSVDQDHGNITETGMIAVVCGVFIVLVTFIGWLVRRFYCNKTESATIDISRMRTGEGFPTAVHCDQQNNANVYSTALCPQTWLAPPPYPGQPGEHDTRLQAQVSLPRYSELYDENGEAILPAYV